jgi:subtilisin family serine protease
LLALDDPALLAARDAARRALYLRTGALDHLGVKEMRFLLNDRLARHNWLSAGYQFVDGTSVAAPVVSSVAVQMIEANPSLTPAAIKDLLMATAVPMQDVPAEKQGAGVVNPAGAVARALRAPGGPLVGYPQSPAPAPDGGITFYYYNPRVRQVALVGDFNGWFAAGYRFAELGQGIFRFHLAPLPPGYYRYKFLLDDSSAVEDPESLDKEPDGYGGFNSCLTIAS